MEAACCLQLVSSVIFAHLESDWIWGRGVLKVMFICSLVKSATGYAEQHLREGKCHSRDTFLGDFCPNCVVTQKVKTLNLRTTAFVPGTNIFLFFNE